MNCAAPDNILRFLRWFCPEHLVEEIEGDLIQKFEKDIRLFGISKARRRFAWNAIRFMRPGIIFRNKFSFDLINTNMIRNYMTIAFRNFNRQRSYTLLNVIGLSLGMAASLLIIQYVKYEKSFDRFHSRADDIYRIQYNGWKNGELNFESAVAVPAAPAALKSNFPEVEAYTRFLPTDTLEVAGVIADFHQMSLKAKVLPVAYRLFYVSAFYSIKLETANYKDVIESIEGPWNTFFPGSPVEYFFLDQFFNRQYERDDRFSQVFTLFTVLAIFIASLGLLGLASFMALQRTKEIGIRKVLGASASGIVGLLSRGFMKPVLLAIVIACPLGWWLMDLWLQSFPYRIIIEPWVFFVSGMLVLMIAFISVSSQTLKAAVTKPAETLKYE